MKYYIGADLGTSALKLLLVDMSGNIVKEVSRTYPVYYPQPSWSEQNPEDWWEAFVSGVRELVFDVDSSEVSGIGVGGQMHGLVVLDEKDRVIRPAILWNDGRTDRETSYLNDTVGKDKLSHYTANIMCNFVFCITVRDIFCACTNGRQRKSGSMGDNRGNRIYINYYSYLLAYLIHSL
jgi:sugar (pentulose or hexulose) kinase